MTRFAVLLAGCLCCPAAHGFPAPQPKQPRTYAELIVGVWELTKEKDLKAVGPPMFFEFRRDGTVRAFGKPGRDRDDKFFGYYLIVDNHLLIREKPAGEIASDHIIEIQNDKIKASDGIELRRR